MSYGFSDACTQSFQFPNVSSINSDSICAAHVVVMQSNIIRTFHESDSADRIWQQNKKTTN